eukprot:642108-Pleurochrysis_carterae.AAC.1
MPGSYASPPLVGYLTRVGGVSVRGTDSRGVLPDMITCVSEAHYPLPVLPPDAIPLESKHCSHVSADSGRAL